jgi:uncharacterized Zn-binding protein involved in type VI secretion
MVGTTGQIVMTAHGKPLSPGAGSPNIFVRGRNVWRVGFDFHSCPITVPNSHVGGMILLGRHRILANNFQVAFKGDVIFEATSVNRIII